MIVAIDTSTSQAGVALSGSDGPLAELTWIAGRDHSTHLFRAIEAVTGLSARRIEDATGIAVAAGPGSFSGIRVGLSFGKALAMGLDIPLVAIGTLEVIAAGACTTGRVWTVLAAGRGQLYMASFEHAGLETTRTSEYVIASPEEAAELVSEGDHLAGEGAGVLADAVRRAGKSASLSDPVNGMRRALYLAELGKMYFARGGTDQSHEAEPLYLRRSAAEEKRDAAQR